MPVPRPPTPRAVARSLLLAFCLLFLYSNTKLLVLLSADTQKLYRTDDMKNGKNNSAPQIATEAWTEVPVASLKTVAQDWTEVKGSERRLFIYSAFHDTRTNPPSVRLIVILKQNTKLTECQIWTNRNSFHKTKAKSKLIRENWGLLYCAAFVLCTGFKLSSDDIITDVAVGLPGLREITKVKVEKFPNEKQLGSFSVCVKPFHYEFNRAVWLVEFIELHRILGVEKFFFYNHSVGIDVEAVLQHYVKKGVVEVSPWSLPVKTQKEIRTEGIFAALNDCNLRNVGKYEYTIMIDTDEFIIPRKENNYSALISNLKDSTSFVFQNAFFYLYWDNDTRAMEALYGSADAPGTRLLGAVAERRPYLLTAAKTTRLSKPHKHGQRSKYICKPEKTIECGNHLVWEGVGGKPPNLNVNADVALVHHYRICEFGGFDCLKKAHEIDRTAHKYLSELFESVTQTCSFIFPSLGACPEAPPLGSPW